MTPEQVYNQWLSTLKEPDDSLFYYHPSLERILLGFAIFVLSSRPLLGKLGKAESLGILHYQVPDLITAWIDEDNETFETMFNMVMTVAEGYTLAGRAMADQYPSRQKAIKRLTIFFGNAVACAGDMDSKIADELLDDLSTDGNKIYSEKIQAFGAKLLHLTTQYGIDIPPSKLTQLLA